MDARLDFLASPLAMKLIKQLNSVGATLADSTVPAATQGAGAPAGKPDQRLRLLHRHAHQRGPGCRGKPSSGSTLVAAWREADGPHRR